MLGISLLILLNAVEIPLSLMTVTLGHIVICVPFAITVLMSRFDGFDRSLEEASLDLGENGWMTFWRVTFPLVLPGIVSSLLLTFIVSFDDFLIAYFLAGTDSDAADLHLGPAALSLQAAGRAGARRDDPRRLGRAGGARRMDPQHRRSERRATMVGA